MCVGGLDFESRSRHPRSNFGHENRDSVSGTVDIFAPFHVLKGPDPADMLELNFVGGTSFSSPYVTGVAALSFAADPSQSAGQVQAQLLATAQTHDLGDDVNRIVDAQALVAEALTGVCPCIKIVSPEAGAFGLDGRAMSVEMAFYAPQDVTLNNVRWSVHRGDASGPVVKTADGETASFIVRGGGVHTLVATANFSDGSTVTDEVEVVFENVLPVAQIQSPAPRLVFTDTETVSLRAIAHDPGFPEGLPDDHIRWYVNDGTAPIATGADTTHVFLSLSPGRYQLRLDVTDGTTTASDSVSFFIVPAGSNSPPVANIFSPRDGGVFVGLFSETRGNYWYIAEIISHSSDPDGDPLTLTWSLSSEDVDGPYVELPDTGTTFRHMFTTDSCFGTRYYLRLTVSDGEFERTDTISFRVVGAAVC